MSTLTVSSANMTPTVIVGSTQRSLVTRRVFGTPKIYIIAKQGADVM